VIYSECFGERGAWKNRRGEVWTIHSTFSSNGSTWKNLQSSSKHSLCQNTCASLKCSRVLWSNRSAFLLPLNIISDIVRPQLLFHCQKSETFSQRMELHLQKMSTIPPSSSCGLKKRQKVLNDHLPKRHRNHVDGVTYFSLRVFVD
jgi:hypothetical protein